MAIDVDRVEAGYIALVSPPHSSRDWFNSVPLPESELRGLLISLGVNARDVLDAIAFANEAFERGLSDRVRAFRDMRDRALRGELAEHELEMLRSELVSRSSQIDKVSLIGTLRLSGQSASSVETLCSLLQTTQEHDAVIAALSLLADWHCHAFEDQAPRFMLGADWDASRDVQAWALLHAARYLQSGGSDEFFDFLLRAATDKTQSADMRQKARRAIIGIADPPILTRGSSQTELDREFDSIVKAARQVIANRRNGQAQDPR
ncbi:MAG: hypothetical protein WEC75_14895 [Dehalococcoidia bacterium]